MTDRKIVAPRKPRARKDTPSERAHWTGIHRRLKVEWRPIESLKADLTNPRVHSRKQIGQIADSIAAFGFNVPILVDAEAHVIAGHGRILAAELLGWSEVPTICLDHLTESQVRGFAIADNRLTENSTWDDRLLAEQLQELSALDLDFNLEDLGFEMGDIDLRIQALKTQQATGDDRADILPSESSGPPVSRLGDLWLLGPHRVYCGSALEDTSYVTLMRGEKAAMVFTDPPYNVSIEKNVSGPGSIRHRNFQMAFGEMTEAEFIAFLVCACSLFARNSRNGSLHYLFMDWRHMRELLIAGREVYAGLKNLCIWAKDRPGMGSLYRSQHELVFVYKHGREHHSNNIQLGACPNNTNS